MTITRPQHEVQRHKGDERFIRMATLEFLTEAGLWRQRLNADSFAHRPALFLDRDGVVVEEVNYLSRIEDVAMIEAVGPAIARANQAGLPVIMVTNQAGVGRGYFSWDEFAAVQTAILERLAVQGARFDMVLACGYHEEGIGHYAITGHPWRKPGAGMLLEAARTLDINLTESLIVGDKLSDLEAGLGAGLGSMALALSGYGAAEAAAALAQWHQRVEIAFEVVLHAGIAIDNWLAGLETISERSDQI